MASLISKLVAIVAICFAVAAKAAEPDPGATERQAAHERLVQGVAMLKTGDYSGALSKFEEAYALVPSPNIYYDFGLAYAGLGRPADALDAFERFLAEAPGAPASARENAERDRRTLRAHVGALAISTEAAGMEVLVDGRQRGVTPLPHPVYVEPGPHDVSARPPLGLPGPAQRVNIAAGVTMTLSLASGAPRSVAVLPPAAAGSAPSPQAPATTLILRLGTSEDARARRTWAISTGAAGAALLGAGLTFGLLARYEGDQLSEASKSSTAENRKTYDPEKQALGHRFETLMIISVTAGAVATLTSAILFATMKRHAGAGPSGEIRF